MSTINRENHINANDTLFVKQLRSDDAEKVKENNKYGAYELMKNKWGREVPVAVELVADKLSKGFIRTDGVVHTDRPEDRVRAPLVESDPHKVMAKLTEQLVESNKSQTEALKEIAKEKKDKKSV